MAKQYDKQFKIAVWCSDITYIWTTIKGSPPSLGHPPL